MVDEYTTDRDTEARQRRPFLSAAKRDFVPLGIAAAAVIMFVGTGGQLMIHVSRQIAGIPTRPIDPLTVSTLLLNIALIIFIMRRHRDLTREVAERRKAERRARELADIDPLTGCLNRRSIAPATDQLAGLANRNGRSVAFVMIDLDNFKQVNDIHGHLAGDLVLREAADRIRTLLPAEALLARLGGDEFAIVVSYDRMVPNRIDQLVTRIIESIAEPFALPNGETEITMSVGIAADRDESTKAQSPHDAQALIHKADIAMYEAKKRGKNRFFWFEAPMENELRFRSELERGIREGIGRGEFVPYYEQQIDLATGEISGFEMLARWKSPEHGLVSPEVFIPIAEDIGVIAALSESLIEQAFEDAREWDSQLTLSINISPVQLRDPWFSQKILKLLMESGFPPSRLDIEVTESCLHENIGVVRSMITSLKNQGVRISLDDFGTGYSSLAQLRSLPFDRIKIDRSFVSDVAENGSSTKIVAAIATLGEGLDMPIVAEGIESEEILSALQSIGIRTGQGFLFGYPEPAASVERRLLALSRTGPARAASQTGDAAQQRPSLAG